MNSVRFSSGYIKGILYVGVASFGWGLNWPAMKYLIEECPPLLARGSSGILAAIGLYFLSRFTGERRSKRKTSSLRVILGAFLNVFAWMGFSTLSLQWLTAGQGALLVYTMPIWTVFWSWVLQNERPTFPIGLGLSLSIIGLTVLFGSPGMDIAFTGALFALTAAIFFALGTVILKPPGDIPPFRLLSFQLAAGSIPMVAIDLWHAKPIMTHVTPLGWALFAYMTVMPMGICYLAWYAALRRIPATVASGGAMLTPVIGAFAGAFFLGERFGVEEFAALVFIIGGILFIVLGRSRPSAE